MRNYYSNFATGKFKDAIENAAAHKEKASLEGEVAAARALCTEAIKTFSAVAAAEDLLDDDGNKKITPALRGMATKIAQDSLEHVSKIVERMAKVMAMSDLTLDTGQVDFVVTQIMNIITLEFDGEPDRLQNVMDQIHALDLTKKKGASVNITIS